MSGVNFEGVLKGSHVSVLVQGVILGLLHYSCYCEMPIFGIAG